MSNLKSIHSAVRMPPVNKIMVVGHPLSGYQAVEQRLYQCGLQPAAVSKSQGLSPSQVSEMLMRAYRVAPLDAGQAVEQFSPIEPSPVWQTLALDLLLGNLDQMHWGWSDPQAIYLLDYWKQLDHQMGFVLVYDSPHDTLARIFDLADADCNPTTMDIVIQNWMAYNEALLNFYLGNTERCVLVHTQQAHASDCALLMQHHLGLGLVAPDAQTCEQAAGDPMHDLRRFLCSRVLAKHIKLIQLYEDMQSVAHLPYKSEPTADEQLAALASLKALLVLHKSNQQIQASIEALKALKQAQAEAFHQRISLAGQAADQAQAEIEKLRIKEASLQKQLTALVETHQQAIEKGVKQASELNAKHQKEAELLSKLQELTASLQKAQQAEKDAKSAQARATAHATVTSPEKVKELEAENQLLLEQLHVVQEELERYYLENQDLKRNQIKPSVKLYGAAQRIQQQLNYRLGATMIANCRSVRGWLRMPKALMSEVRLYRKEQSTQAAQKLPPLETYADAHEAERYRKHLSYQLGQTMLKHAKTPWGWLWMPFALNSRVSAFKKARA